MQLRSLEPVIPGGHGGLPVIPAAGGGGREAPEKDVLKTRLAISAISMSSGFDWEICLIVYQVRMIPDTNFWLPYVCTDTCKKSITTHVLQVQNMHVHSLPYRQKWRKKKQNKTFNMKEEGNSLCKILLLKYSYTHRVDKTFSNIED